MDFNGFGSWDEHAHANDSTTPSTADTEPVKKRRRAGAVDWASSEIARHETYDARSRT